MTRRVTSRQRSLPDSNLRAQSDSGSREPESPARAPFALAPDPAASDPRVIRPPATSQALPDISNQTLMQFLASIPQSGSRLTNEAAAVLEFLAHGRRNVLDRFAGKESVGHQTTPSPVVVDGQVEHWDTFLPIEDARMLLVLHQAHLTWMHNVLHLPTFLQEFEENILCSDCDKSWIALYYALLSVSLFRYW